ncbi:predicted protein [Naegleria gruberi]|uniref:Predicted protein n=1 Tax=Naegleria gruberi TaxID=5762 RepID=D2VXW4_NAEGR|nr:uncharacterized protein NAEGRDRAFT_73900 [Naegleria gruberi]EFC38360.1 predicted protein [Naegleria gruberi]|eukprot:XP_002671104.1 predicted protein [Naegleria gruberi strain NEG-M]
MNEILQLTHESIKHLDVFMSNYVPYMKSNISTDYPDDKLSELNFFDGGMVKLWIFMLENYSLTMVTIVLPFVILFLNYFIPSGLMWLVEWCDFDFLRKYKIQPVSS